MCVNVNTPSVVELKKLRCLWKPHVFTDKTSTALSFQYTSRYVEVKWTFEQYVYFGISGSGKHQDEVQKKENFNFEHLHAGWR